MYLSKIKKVVAGACLAFSALPMASFAAGLGPLSVTSGIGEPLKADIQLLSVSAAEKASLKARIAPAASYAAQGIERPASHNGIRIRVTKSASGKNILNLHSDQPMTEPFLDMLVELEWETGRILREYTVLLDPPGYDRTLSTSTVQAPAIKTLDKSKIAPIKNTSKSTRVSSARTSQPQLEGDYLTKRGDTLSKIARRMKPEGVSLDEMLVGLYEANPEAFDGKNMNRLKVGKILQPPTQEALNAITRKQATKEVKVQAANWNKYRNKLAGIVADSVPVASETDKQTASGKITSSAEDQSVPESTGPKDVVKLSSGDAKAQADMQAKITALEEEVSAREKGLQEAQERTAALEKQIEDMQKLLTLKNNALSDAQQLPGDTAEASDSTDVSPSSEVETAVAEAVESAEAAPEVKPEIEAAKPAESAAPVESAKPASPAVEPKPTSKPIPKAAEPTPVEEPSFVEGILNTVKGVLAGLNMLFLAGGAAVIALLAGAWFFLRNKRRKNLADFEQGIMTSGGLKANTVFGNTSGASVDTGDTSFLTDFSQSTTGGMIDTNDVDPIAEAEVYMAYGRDAQAEEILKDAISKEPKRYELHLKLLEMYAASKNMSAFETVSGELYTTLGAEDPTWAKVAEIGIKLEPNNPLYLAKAGVGIPAEAEIIEETVDEPEVAAVDENAIEGELDAADFADSPLADESDLDFSLDSEPEPASVEEVTEVPEVSEPVVTDTPEVPEVSDTTLEFDMNAATNEQATEEVAAPAVAEESNFTDTMPSLDFPSLDTSAPEEVEAPSLEAAITEPAVEIPSDLTLDMPSVDAVEEAPAPEVEEVAAPTLDSVDFDMSSLEGDTISLGETDDSTDDAGLMDMSDISLDVNDDVDQAIAEATQAVEHESISMETESEEVETKLELVAAYIDMDDKEGAKELLDEVLKEGGDNQRQRAEELLATLS